MEIIKNETTEKRNKLEHSLAETDDMKTKIKIKVKEMEAKVSQQRLDIVTKLFHMKETEAKVQLTCRCRGWCGINHIKHAWQNSKATELKSKFSHVTCVIKNM